MGESKLLGDEYRQLYARYYDSDVAEKREITADDTIAHLQEVAGAERFGKVLDVGAGEGSLLSRMEKVDFGESLYAVEISESGAEAIRSRQLSRLREVQIFDGYTIPYPDKFFDLAICIHVLEHVEHERILLSEMKRVARRVIIEVPLENVFSLERKLAGKVDPYGHINFYTPTSFINLLRTSGLVPIKTRVGSFSVRFEQYLDGKSKGFVKSYIRRIGLTVCPRLAPFFITYFSTAYCDAGS